MPNLLAPTGALFPSRPDRQIARVCDQIDARAAVARYADQAQIERLTTTTAYAMGAAAHLAAVEAFLGAIAPEAREQLRAIRLSGTVGIAGVVCRAGLGS